MSKVSVAILSDLIDDIRSGFASGQEDLGGIFQIRMNNITRDGAIDISKRRYVPNDKKVNEGTLLRAGDVVFNMTNSPDLVGKTAIFPGLREPVVYSNHFLRIRTNEKVLRSDYLARWLQLQFKRGVFKSMSRQWVNQATVSKDALLGLSIPLVPLEMQRKASATLDLVDALRAKRRAAIALLDDLIQSVFLDMFGNPSSGWPVENLGVNADVQGGLQVTSKRKSNPLEVPYLRVANVYRNKLDLREIKNLRVTEKELARTRLVAGDLLIVEGHGNAAEIGRVAIWDGSIDSCTHQNHLIRARLDVSSLLPEYAVTFLNSHAGRRFLLNAASTTSGLHTISTSDVRNVPLKIPPIALQQRYWARVREIRSLRGRHERHLSELGDLFGSLQQRAFRGELWND